MRMLVKAIPILHGYLSQLKIIDILILQKHVCLHILAVHVSIYVCMFVVFVCVHLSVFFYASKQVSK